MHVVWKVLGRYVRCMKLWCMREQCPFLTVKNLRPVEEYVVEICGVLLQYKCVSDIDGTHMNTYTYQYRMDGPH